MARFKKPDREESRRLRQQLADRARSGALAVPSAVVDIRRSIGMTQSEFATMLGMSRRQIADIERGAANPTLDTLNKIGRLFGFTVGFVPVERPFIADATRTGSGSSPGVIASNPHPKHLSASTSR